MCASAANTSGRRRRPTIVSMPADGALKIQSSDKRCYHGDGGRQRSSPVHTHPAVSAKPGRCGSPPVCDLGMWSAGCPSPSPFSALEPRCCCAPAAGSRRPPGSGRQSSRPASAFTLFHFAMLEYAAQWPSHGSCFYTPPNHYTSLFGPAVDVLLFPAKSMQVWI